MFPNYCLHMSVEHVCLRCILTGLHKYVLLAGIVCYQTGFMVHYRPILDWSVHL